MPTSDQPDLVIDNVDVQQHLQLAEPELTRARFLVERLAPQVWTTASRGKDGDWRFVLDLERVRRFRGILNGDELLLARGSAQSFAQRLDQVERRGSTV